MSNPITTKRLAAITVLAAMTLSPFVAATANADTATGGDITVSAGSKGTVKGHTVKYVKIAGYSNVNYDTDGNPTSLDMANTLDAADEAKLKAAVAQVDSKYDTTAQAQYSPEQWVTLNWKGANADRYGNPLSDNENMTALAGLLGGSDATYSLIGANTPSVDADASGKTITVPVDYGTDNDANYGGLYLLVDQTADDNSSKSHPMIVPSGIQKADGTIATTLGSQTLGQVNIKNQIVTISSTREDKLPTLGDKVKITSTFTGPDFTGITNPVLRLWTDPSVSLDQPTESDITVTVDGKDYPAQNNWTLNLKSGAINDTTGTKDANAFNITFADPAGLTGKTVVISYNGRINTGEFDQANGDQRDMYSSTSTLEYSNDPSSNTTGKPSSTVEGPLSRFNIKKVELGNDAKQLVGARFQVLDSQDNPLKFSEQTVQGISTFYYDPNGTITDLGGDQLSYFAVAGLDRGTYTIKETKAPADHILGQGVQQLSFKVTVAAEASTDGWNQVTITNDPGSFAKYVEQYLDDQKGESFYVRNATSLGLDQLPVTGSAGIMIAAGVVLLLVLGGAATTIGRKTRLNK